MPVFAKNIGGAEMPDKLMLESTNLTLNGGGVIKKFFLKVYAIGLYLENKSGDANSILNSDKPYIIRMHFLRGGITSDKINDSWKEGFGKATGNNTASIQNEINKFIAIFNFEIQDNNIFQFEYKPGAGTKVFVNNSLKGTISGFAFKKALLGIWLGAKPRDEDVKEAMLGK